MTKLQEQVIEQMHADYEVIGEKYMSGLKEIEQLQEYVVTEIVALKAENNRLRLVLKDIYHRSNDAEIRNMAWDAAHDAAPSPS
jgi:regulator of replication initiation timing